MLETTLTAAKHTLATGEAENGAQAQFYYQKGFTFILTEKRTIVKTHHQTFLIKHDHRNYIKQLEILREKIRNNEINSLVDLVDYCSYKTGGFKDQMCGLELVPTKLEWHL